MKKCKKCEINYVMNENEDYCPLCKAKIVDVPIDTGIRKTGIDNIKTKHIGDVLIVGVPYDTAAKKVFLECCDVFGFNSLQADEFVWGHPLYAGKSTKEGYGVWFISRSNLNYEPNESNWIDEFNDNGNYIIEHWKALYSLGLSIYENSDTRVVFAKIAGYYQFMGVYKCAEVNIEKRYKRYDRISKVYPIE